MKIFKIMFSSIRLFHMAFSRSVDDINLAGDSLVFFLISAYMCVNLLLLSQRKRAKGSTSTSSAANSIHAKEEPLSKIVKIVSILLAADITLFIAAQLLIISPSRQLGFSAPLVMAGALLLIALLVTSIMTLPTRRNK